MASELLEADPVTVLTRFSDEVQLACPLFQRRYVWAKKNIDQLWDDFDTVLDGQYAKRFLGALVFNNESAPTASKAGRYWIIDGQQRLTTLYLMLVAIAEIAGGLDEEGREFGQDVFRTYLVSSRSQTKNQPKFRPTLVDSKQFEGILHRSATACGAPVDVNPTLLAGDAEGAMTVGYALLKKHVTKRLDAPTFLEDAVGATDLDVLEVLRNAVLEKLELVEIRLGNEHDPNEVFDRLNKEGERLGIIDLVRNQVLKHLDSDPHTAQAVYSQEWKPFEEAFADDQAKAGYFFPFALTLNEQATQATTFATLTDHWASTLADVDEPKIKVQQMVADLRRHQSSYNAIHSGRLAQLDEPVLEQVRRLVALGRPSVSYAYLVRLLTEAAEGNVSANSTAECLALIESFLVRRALCGIEPTGLHAVFKKLWSAAGADPALVGQRLETATVVFPSDEQFAGAIRKGDLYHRRICRYVLEEYERAHTAGDVLATFPTITADHVAPQSLAGDWANDFRTEEERALVHTWANLVPLSSEANSTKGCSNWDQARSKLQLETVFSTTKHLYDAHPQWRPEDVRARAEELVEWALGRWSTSVLS